MGKTKNLSKWLDWIYKEKENNFFFFCDIHKAMMVRPQDGISATELAKSMSCDYPDCKNFSEWEYFPNLFLEFKKYGTSKFKRKNVY